MLKKNALGIVVIGLVVFVLLGMVWAINRYVFSDSLPFTSDPNKIDKYRDIGTIESLDKLLLAEKLFGGRMGTDSEMLAMKATPKVFHGDVVYIFDDNGLYRTNVEKRPLKYVSFSKVKFNGRIGYVLGEKVKNRDGSVSFLHFGFLGEAISGNDNFKTIINRLNNSAYVVPMAEIQDCSRIIDNRELCEQLDADMVSGLVTEWIRTGNVPKRLETILLVPYIYPW